MIAWQSAQVSLLLLFFSANAWGQNGKPHAAAADEWKGTDYASAHSACIRQACDQFDMDDHQRLMPQGKLCSDALNASVYRQDVLHALESKAHFDNCAFEDGVDYVQTSTQNALKILRAIKGPRGQRAEKDAEEALKELGRALHAIQDLYAHSNYIELFQTQHPTSTSETDIPVVDIWQPAGRIQIETLVSEGLISGRVGYSVPPKYCRASDPTHGQLAKDSPRSNGGSVPSIYRNRLTKAPISNHNIAYNMARRATQDYLAWVAQKAPGFEAVCGPVIKYVVQTDRRGNADE